MYFGLIVILVGVLFFLKNTALIAPFAWDTLWPIILILLGIALVGRRSHSWMGRGMCNCDDCRSFKGGMNGTMNSNSKVCSCDCDSCKNCNRN